jgi:putative transcriptional regulator
MFNIVREERLRQEKSQSALASFCGVSRQSIHAIEAQKLRPTVYLAILISRFLNTPVEEIFFTEEKNVRKSIV